SRGCGRSTRCGCRRSWCCSPPSASSPSPGRRWRQAGGSRAGCAAVRGNPSRFPFVAVLVTVEAVAIVLLGLLVAGLLRSHAEILRALHDLGVGVGDEGGEVGVATPVTRGAADADGHDVVGVSPDEQTVTVGVVGARQPTLLAFLSSGCL